MGCSLHLVERTTRLVILARMDGTDARSAREARSMSDRLLARIIHDGCRESGAASRDRRAEP